MHVAISEFIDPIRRRRIDSRCSLSRFVVARFVRRLVSSDRALSHNTLVLLPLQHTYEFTHAALDYVQATRLSSTKNRGVARAQRLMRARKPHQRRRTARVSAAETRSHAELIAREPISFCKFIHQWQSNGLRARLYFNTLAGWTVYTSQQIFMRTSASIYRVLRAKDMRAMSFCRSAQVKSARHRCFGGSRDRRLN